MAAKNPSETRFSSHFTLLPAHREQQISLERNSSFRPKEDNLKIMAKNRQEGLKWEVVGKEIVGKKKKKGQIPAICSSY